MIVAMNASPALALDLADAPAGQASPRAVNTTGSRTFKEEQRANHDALATQADRTLPTPQLPQSPQPPPPPRQDAASKDDAGHTAPKSEEGAAMRAAPPGSARLGSTRTSFAPSSEIAERFASALASDQRRALRPDYRAPFRDARDVVERLLPYHVFNVPDEDLWWALRGGERRADVGWAHKGGETASRLYAPLCGGGSSAAAEASKLARKRKRSGSGVSDDNQGRAKAATRRGTQLEDVKPSASEPGPSLIPDPRSDQGADGRRGDEDDDSVFEARYRFPLPVFPPAFPLGSDLERILPRYAALRDRAAELRRTLSGGKGKAGPGGTEMLLALETYGHRLEDEAYADEVELLKAAMAEADEMGLSAELEAILDAPSGRGGGGSGSSSSAPATPGLNKNGQPKRPRGRPRKADKEAQLRAAAAEQAGASASGGGGAACQPATSSTAVAKTSSTAKASRGTAAPAKAKTASGSKNGTTTGAARTGAPTGSSATTPTPATAAAAAVATTPAARATAAPAAAAAAVPRVAPAATSSAPSTSPTPQPPAAAAPTPGIPTHPIPLAIPLWAMPRLAALGIQAAAAPHVREVMESERRRRQLGSSTATTTAAAAAAAAMPVLTRENAAALAPRAAPAGQEEVALLTGLSERRGAGSGGSDGAGGTASSPSPSSSSLVMAHISVILSKLASAQLAGLATLMKELQPGVGGGGRAGAASGQRASGVGGGGDGNSGGGGPAGGGVATGVGGGDGVS